MRESPLFVKSYDFLKWLLEHTTRFPKSQRFVMAKRVEEAALSFHDSLLAAAGEKEDKKRLLRQASLELERLRTYLRLCLDLRLLSLKQYEHSSRQLVEVGRLLGAWLKKVPKGMGDE